MPIQKPINKILHAVQHSWNRFVNLIQSGIKALYDAIKPTESSFTIAFMAKMAEEQALHTREQLEEAQQKNAQNKSPPKIEKMEPRLSSTEEYNHWSLGIRTESQKREDKKANAEFWKEERKYLKTKDATKSQDKSSRSSLRP